MNGAGEARVRLDLRSCYDDGRGSSSRKSHGNIFANAA
jgi:hypothetical protein